MSAAWSAVLYLLVLAACAAVLLITEKLTAGIWFPAW